MKTIKDFNFNNKTALIRVDFNVPLNADFKVTDDTRIQSAKPTILKVLEDGGKVVLMSHLGRPKGKSNPDFSLQHIASTVSEILGVEVNTANDIVGKDAQEKYAKLEQGQVLLLENLRFNPGEEEGNQQFAKQLAQFGDVYVNDAFGTAHRKHASTAVVAEFFGDNKCFGFLMEQELTAIDKVLKSGEKPITGILGGAKVSSKITIIDNILPALDNIIIAGGMAYTFIKAQGGKVGNSIVEEDKLQLALDILKQAKENNVNVYLPIDTVVADDFNNNANINTTDTNAIPDQWQGLDIGPKSVELFSDVIHHSKTILWNGPMGVFEFDNFSAGTIAVGKAIGEATKNGAFSLVGGGDSVSAVKQFGMESLVSYVSTGGGAMLESLEGKQLPGVAAILD